MTQILKSLEIFLRLHSNLNPKMEIIMLKDVDKVGDKDTIVKVKDGFGRNYLIPQKLAIVANAGNRSQLAAKMRRSDAKENLLLDTYRQQAAGVEGKTVTIHAKAGTSGKIFGSVSVPHVLNALKSQFGIEADRKKVVMGDIKELGSHAVTINFHKQVAATFNVEVVGEEAK
jgi:large subunit ribosomal protein L9